MIKCVQYTYICQTELHNKRRQYIPYNSLIQSKQKQFHAVVAGMKKPNDHVETTKIEH